MFNYLAAALMVYLMVNVFRETGQMSPQSVEFDSSMWIPSMHEVLAKFGIAGIKPSKIIILSMLISGALAGMVGVNEILGVNHRLLLDFHVGYGFAGIAVSLMGRNHPLGIVIASLLFGILYQGGAELAFEMSGITRDIVVVMQGLVILFSGALEFLYKPFIGFSRLVF